MILYNFFTITLPNYANEIMTFFDKKQPLTIETFFTGLYYEFLFILILVIGIIIILGAISSLFLPICIITCIKNIWLRYYCKSNPNLYAACKVNERYNLEKLANILYHMEPSNEYLTQKLCHRWKYIKHIQFLPDQDKFTTLIKTYQQNYMTDEKTYNKLLCDTIKDKNYVTIIHNYHSELKPYQTHIEKKIFPILITMYIIYVLILIPIVGIIS